MAKTAPMSNIADILVTSTPGLVSIIMPCCGMLEYTKLSVPSVLRFSRRPIELIFLDIGSLDGTAEYLAGIKAACDVRVEVIRTPVDLGIPDACKEAITEARGEYLVLLNNDTVVTEGWLEQLIDLVNLNSGFGMVGPMSNYAPLAQLVETVPYRIKPRRGTTQKRSGADKLLDVDAVHRFAVEFREQNKRKWIEVDRLAGFCLLLKRQVLNRIGLPNLEKWTDLSLFDTDILSTKARQAGFTLVCCRDLFIHHFGTRTFSHGAPSSTSQAKDRRMNGATS